MTEADKTELKEQIRATFSLSIGDLAAALVGNLKPGIKEGPNAKDLERELRSIIPTGGYFFRYIDFTEHSEAPLAYHLFCALLGVGATVNRRVWFDMGYYHLFPNLGIILLGPSGIKKTTAANIIINMLTELELTKIYSEKLTPEQLIESMRDMAQGVIYAPEMAVFLGRQRYMEGIVPLITRFMDCPDVWASETIMRGKRSLHDVAISSLMCSTLEWFLNNTSEDVVSGGFIARNILVVQEDSARLEHIPKPGNPKLRDLLIAELARIHTLEGELTLDAKTYKRHEAWYSEQKIAAKTVEHELLATYYQRKPDHVKRVAMCLHLAEHSGLSLDLECFERAVAIMDWVEKFLPGVIRKMFKTASGHEADLVLNVIRQSGGVIDHSELVRKVQYRVNALQLRGILMGLKDAQQVAEHHDNLQHVWLLTQEGGNEGI